MACPRGCVNGAGQIKGANTEESKRMTQEVLQLMKMRTNKKKRINLNEKEGLNKFIMDNIEHFKMKFNVIKKEKSVTQFQW